MQEKWIIIITVIGGAAAVIYLIDFISGQKIKKQNRILLLLVVSVAGIALAFNLISNIVSARKPEDTGISKFDTNKKQTEPGISETDNRKKQDDPSKNKSVLDNSINNSKNKIIEPKEIINNSEKADFAVIVTTNGKKDNHLTSAFVDWLKANGTVSQSILQSLFIEQGYFNQILDGNSSVIKKTTASQSAKNLCLARSTITYNPSKIDESLVVATCVYGVVVVEAATGKVIDSFEQIVKSSGVSEEMAKQRAEDDFIKYLNQKKLSL